MDYSILAAEFLNNMKELRTASPQRNISEAMHGEAFVLGYLAHNDEEVLPSKISHDMDVSSARIAQTLNSIEKKGWITRQIDTNDRRRIIVRLTPEGRAQADSHTQSVIEHTVQMLRLLGKDDAREYVRITGKLAEQLAANKEKLQEG